MRSRLSAASTGPFNPSVAFGHSQGDLDAGYGPIRDSATLLDRDQEISTSLPRDCRLSLLQVRDARGREETEQVRRSIDGTQISIGVIALVGERALTNRPHLVMRKREGNSLTKKEFIFWARKLLRD